MIPLSSSTTPPPSPKSGLWRLVVRLAAGAVLVGYLALHTKWAPVAAAVRNLDWACWLAALGVYLASQVVSSWRWAELARPLGFAFSRMRYAQLYFSGMFFSLCLPSSIGGDVLKAYWLAPTVGGRILAGCTVLADRVSGVIGLAVIGLAALAGRNFVLGWGATLLVGAGLLVAALTAVTLGLWLLKWFHGLLPPASGLGRLVEKLLPYHERPEVFRRSIGWGLAVQMLNVGVVILIGRAMGLAIPTAAYCVAVPTVALLTILPLSISGVGIREGGLAWMLAGYGVSQELSVTLGLLWFLATAVGGLIGGLVYLGSEGASGGAPAESDAKAEAGAPSPVVLPLIVTRIPDWSLSVVVPVCDELDNLERLYNEVTQAMDALDRPYELLLIDDGSKDGSGAKLDELAAADARVKVVHFRRNYGQTAALDAGIQLATGDVIVTLDADLQNDPADIPLLLAKLAKDFDLVHGWRRERHDPWLSRRLPSRIANRLISWSTGFPVHDLGCTLRAMRRETAQELRLYGEMHRFIPILAHWNGARCTELVTRHHPRRAGRSKYGLSRTVRVVLDLLTVKYMIQYLTSPMKLFGTFGLASAGVGLLSGIATLAMWFNGYHLNRNPLLLLTVFAGFVALQFFVLGMLGELGVRTYYESQQKRPYAIRRLVNFAEPAADDKDHRRVA